MRLTYNKKINNGPNLKFLKFLFKISPEIEKKYNNNMVKTDTNLKKLPLNSCVCGAKFQNLLNFTNIFSINFNGLFLI
tara:strand:+ start:554 stop:787 length:234 start_codon:yes stop_codon:yes gene_type:complete